MICPNCMSSYRPGLQTCSACGATLVSESSARARASAGRASYSEASFLDFHSTFDPMELAFIRSVLDAEGVTYYVLGDNAMNVNLVYHVEPLLVRVHEDDFERAGEIVSAAFGVIGGAKENDEDNRI